MSGVFFIGMAMPLATLNDYRAEARRILQDRTEPYRYSDADLATALGIGLYEARKLRPELFPGGTVQEVVAATVGSTPIVMDPQYRMPLVYFMVGEMMSQDEEEGAQGLSGAFKKNFTAKLLILAA